MPTDCQSKIAIWFKNKNHCLALPFIGIEETPIVEKDQIISHDNSVESVSITSYFEPVKVIPLINTAEVDEFIQESYKNIQKWKHDKIHIEEQVSPIWAEYQLKQAQREEE